MCSAKNKCSRYIKILLQLVNDVAVSKAVSLNPTAEY